MRQGEEDVERDRGRDRTRTGRGAERNALGLDRHEDMLHTDCTVSFLP